MLLEYNALYVVSNVWYNPTMLLPRHRLFLDAMKRNGNKIMPSAIEAGYSESYARARGKTLYQTIMKAQVKEIANSLENPTISPTEARRLMSELVGLSPSELMFEARKIATQDKDYGSALKVLIPLLREHGVSLDNEEKAVVVPILNIVVDKNERETSLIEGTPIEQLNEAVE